MRSAPVDVVVRYPGARPAARPPATVEVVQTEYQHEMALLTYYVEPHNRVRYKNGQPVHLSWGHLPREIEEFYGYVLYTVPHVRNNRHQMVVVCIGSSYPLKDNIPTSHPGQSIEQIAATVASQHGFDLVHATSQTQWPSLVQVAGESRWEYLVRMAKRSGYTFFVHRAQMHFYDPLAALSGPNPPYVLRHIAGFGNVVGSLITFHAGLSDDGAGELAYRDYRLVSVDPRNASVQEVSFSGGQAPSLAAHRAEPRFAHYLTGHPVRSPAEAQHRLNGIQRTHRWANKAQAHAFGNVRVRQGSLVRIEGVSDESDGIWYVHKVKHVLSTENHPQQWRYLMDLDLLRDSREIKAPVVQTVRPRRSLSATSDVQVNLRPAPAVLVGGLWQSSNPVQQVLA